jgi:long-chain acyl-CoA synthetase
LSCDENNCFEYYYQSITFEQFKKNNTMKLLTPIEMMYKWEKETPHNVYLRQPIDDVWHEWTWLQVGDEVRRMAAYLKGLNLPPHSNIAMVSKNCAHWMMCDLAIMMSGHVSVPLYPNLAADTIKQILEHSEAQYLFVGKLDDWNAMKPGVPSHIKCISFPFYEHKEYIQWKDIVSKTEPMTENYYPKHEDLATIIYTSGTTGMPKGVMHKFHNFSYAATHALNYIRIGNDSRFFSYLPLCHIAERVLVEMGSFYTGGVVCFAESLDKFPKNLAESKPTVFLGVPRIWTKFQQGILTKMPQKKLNTLLKIPILSGIVKKKIRKKLGLYEAKNIFTGAAPTPASLIEWFATLDIKIQEAYAMTENCCYSHATLRDKIKIGYVGQPLPYCEIKLNEEKEILIKHEALMDGYYKEPQMTKESFTTDGFLKTGDEGYIDNEGFLKITGRVKDLFKTTKGKYVAPSPIEMKISSNSDVEQVCVVGNGLPQPIAMIILSENGKKKSKEEITNSLSTTIEEVNTVVDPHEAVQKAIIMKQDWTLENGLLTPSLKIKRKEVEKLFSPNYEKWYSVKNSAVMWEQ